MWTATIINKELVNGLLKVTVSFTDGTTTFDDRYETRSIQDANWLSSNIERRLADLQGVYGMYDGITLGAYNPEVVIPDPPLTGRALYEKRLDTFEKMVSAIRKGLLAEDNTTFVNLKQWLKNNFDPEYIDLF